MLSDTRKQERIGELFILAQAALYGFLPIIANYATKLMPPVLFAGVCTSIAALCLLPYIIFTGQIRHLLDKKTLLLLGGITLFIVVIPSIFVFIGTSKTSSINTTILLQTELLFTFIICGIFAGEKITLHKGLGALVLLIGATTVLYQGGLKLNWGDLLIVIGTSFYPIGNILSKKALDLTTPVIILFFRSAFGGAMLIAFSLMFERYDATPFEYIKNNLGSILVCTILVYLISKLFWYQGLKRIKISQATAISICMPAFGLFYAVIFLGEIPTLYQVAGLVVIIAGLVLLTHQKSKHYEVMSR
ncbi:MAG: DMT family transporter [Patescibacteria group bacterium]